MALVGPSVAGLFITRFGGVHTLLIDAGTFLISAMFIAVIKAPSTNLSSRERPHTSPSYWKSLSRGFSTLIQQPTLWTLTLLGTAIIVIDTPFMVLVVPYVREVLHASARAVGFLQGSLSAGTLLITFIIAVGGGFYRSLWTWSSVPLFCIATMLMAWAPNLGWALTLQVIGGFATGLFDIRSMSAFQSQIDTNLLAQTLMINNAIAAMAAAMGSLAAGFVAEHFGVRMTFLVFGVLGAALGSLALWRLWRIHASAIGVLRAPGPLR